MYWINIKLDNSNVVEAAVSSVEIRDSRVVISCSDAHAGFFVAMNINDAMYQREIHSLSIPFEKLIYISTNEDTLEESWSYQR